MSGGDDALARDRKASAQDRNERLYARKRWRAARDRAKLDRQAFDPRPPDDDDWTVAEEDTDGVRRISPPVPIGDALGGFVARRGWDERLRGADAWSRWSDIVGPELAERCEPVRVAGGTLVVRATSQVWATQLRYLTSQLRRNADEVLGVDTVRQIRVIVGPLEGRSAPGDR